MPEPQPDLSDIAPDQSHLNQMGKEVVASLCFDALRLAPDGYGVRVEVEGFKQSRAAWDAARLANALEVYGETSPAIAELIEQIDRESTKTAGFPLPNRIRRKS